MDDNCVGSDLVDECSSLGSHDGMGLVVGYLIGSDVVDENSQLLNYDERSHG